MKSRYLQLLRSKSKSARGTSDGALSLPDSPAVDGLAAITLHGLGGIRAASSAPDSAKVVVGCNECGSDDGYLASNNLTEECMDDEENVITWSCGWPTEANVLVIPVKHTNNAAENASITLNVGVQLPGKKGSAQPLGTAVVSIPGPEAAAMADIHPLQEMDHLSVPVEPLQQKARLTSRFGRKKSRAEYVVSPSAVLRLELQVDWKESSTGHLSTMVFDSAGLSMDDAPQFSDASIARSDVAGDGNVDTGSAYVPVPVPESLTPFDEPSEPGLTDSVGSHIGTISAESVEGSKASKTVKIANTFAATHRTVVSLGTIESVDSVFDGCLDKPSDAVIDTPLGKELQTVLDESARTPFRPDERPAQSSDVRTETFEEGNKKDCIADDPVATEVEKPDEDDHLDATKQHEPLSKGEPQPEVAPDDTPVFDVIELRGTDSEISRDLTTGSLSTNDFEGTKERETYAPQQKENVEHQPDDLLKEMMCAEMIDDVAAGLRDILACGLCFGEGGFCADDVNCADDTTHATYDESTMSSAYNSSKPCLDDISESETSVALAISAGIDSVVTEQISVATEEPTKGTEAVNINCDTAQATAVEDPQRQEQVDIDSLSQEIDLNRGMSDASFGRMSVKSEGGGGRAPNEVEANILRERFGWEETTSVYSV